MIYIRKGTEPRSLTEYRNHPGATYEGYREKDALRDALLEEQGYICAYCMRRISKEKMKIEHWKAQNAPDGTGAKHALEYQNMLGVCLGNQSSPHDMQTCDTYRGNAELFVDPRKEAHTQQIAYRGDGTIYSEDSRIDFDLNQRLNLNCEGALLKQGRKEAIRTLQVYLEQKHVRGQWSIELLNKVKRRFESRQGGKYQPYIGAILFWIEHYKKRTQNN